MLELVGVPAAGAGNTDPKHTILLLQCAALQSELEIAPGNIVLPTLVDLLLEN